MHRLKKSELQNLIDLAGRGSPQQLMKAVAVALWANGYRGEEFIDNFSSRFAFDWREIWDVPASGVIEHAKADVDKYLAWARGNSQGTA